MARFRSSAALLLAATAAWAQARPRPEWDQGRTVRVKVDSTPQQAAIYINSRDGGIQGYTPSELRLPPGNYRFILELPGFRAEEHDIALTRPQALAFTLTRQARPATLDVQAGADGSALGGTILINGTALGSVPNRLEMPAGSYLLEVQRPGFQEYRTKITVGEGERLALAVMLAASPPLLPSTSPVREEPVVATPSVAPVQSVATAPRAVEAKVEKQPREAKPLTPEEFKLKLREQTAFGALTVDRYRFIVEAGTGYPYFFSARLITGVFRTPKVGGDIGVEMRTNYYETDIGLRPRVQLFRWDPIAIGADLGIFGGGGPMKRNNFTFELGPILTLMAGSLVRISFKPYLSLTTDQLCPTVGDILDDDRQTGRKAADGSPVPGSGGLYQAEKPICKVYDATRAGQSPTAYQLPGATVTAPAFGQPDPRDRFGNTRLMLQGTLEASLTPHIGLWLLIEGAPFQAERQAFTGKFNDVFGSEDLQFYLRAGISGKF